MAARDETITPIRRRLGALRSRARALLVAERVGGALAALAAGVVAAGLADYAVRFPPPLRWIFWLGLLVAAVWALRRRVIPAIRFAPALTEVALRVERALGADEPGLSGYLAAGVDFASDDRPDQSDLTRALTRRVVEQARERFANARVTHVLDPNGAWRGAGKLVVALAVIVGLSAAWPALASIGAKRILTPWTDAQWPKRTLVADATDVEVHPLGQALPLRAEVTRTYHRAGETPVWARYRVVGRDTWRRVPLTGQGRDDGNGEVYERLVEPASLVAHEGEIELGLEYYFETEDDRTETRRVKLVEPPAVVGAGALVTPPEYAGAEQSGVFASGAFEMGTGDDERAVVGPVLSGSRVHFDVRLNKTLPVEEPDEAWLARTLGVGSLGDDLDAELSDDGWSFEWTATAPVDLRLSLVDEYGLTNPDESSYAFDVVDDAEPTAAMLEPARDESVLATAVVDLVGEGRDDVGIRFVSIERQLARPPAGSEGAPAEPEGGVAEVVRNTDDGAARVAVEATLDLATLDLTPGDEVWLTAVAGDAYSFGGRVHEPVRSAKRVLRIIDEDTLGKQMRGELVGVRRNAMRIDDDQGELARLVERGVVGEEAHRRQAQIGDRIEAQLGVVERLAQRAERNRMDDEALGAMLDDAGRALRGAGEGSDRAEQTLGELAEQDSLKATDEQAEQIAADQQQVRDQLAELVDLLDRGEDGWVVRRAIERLAEQQRELMEQTAQTGARTMGKSLDQLNEGERSELEEITRRQLELAEQAGQTIDELTERARQLEEHDEALSRAMGEAARRGRENQTSQQMQQAGQQAQQNQTADAGRSQQKALDSLEEMLEEIDNADARRDEILRRQLADMIESLDGLIRAQRAELASLDGGEASGEYEGLDAGMIALHTNTLALLDMAERTDGMGPVGDPLEGAVEAQTQSILELRNDTVDPGAVREHEGESLRLLIEARNVAERLQQEADQRETQRRRAELRNAYRKALEEQVVLRHETSLFDVERRLTRRERADLRAIGERQLTLRQRLGELREQTEELRENKVFDYAHDRLDVLTGRAGESLRTGGEVPPIVLDQESSIALLQGLVEALRDTRPDDREFSEGQSGGQNGQGGQPQEQPLIPDVAQVIVLRAMQQQVAQLTRTADEGGASDVQVEELGTLQRDLGARAREVLGSAGGGPPTPEQVVPDTDEEVQ